MVAAVTAAAAWWLPDPPAEHLVIAGLTGNHSICLQLAAA
jgi:hypothetical protein